MNRQTSRLKKFQWGNISLSWIDIATIFLSLLLVFLYCAYIFTAKVEFDDAYNLQVAKNVAEKGVYATNGSQFNGTLKEFDPNISTGPTLLLPIAASFKLAGVDVWQYRVILAGVFCSLSLLTFLYIRRIGHVVKDSFNLPLSLLVTSIACSLFVVVAPHNTYSSLIGEPFAFCLLLLSSICLSYRKFYVAALLLGLAILTKTIFFLAVPFFIVSIVLGTKTWRCKALRVVTVMMFILLPVILFEFYRYISFGSIHAYTDSVKEFVAFFRQSGSGPTDTPTISAIILERINTVLHANDIIASKPIRILILAGLCFFLYKLVILAKTKFSQTTIPAFYSDPSTVFLVGTALLWFGWWFCVSENGWARHLLPAIFTTVVVIAAYVTTQLNTQKNYQLTIFGLAGILFVISGTIAYKVLPYVDELKEQKTEIAAVKQVFKNHPYHHLGWWQNPEVTFLLNVTSAPYTQDVSRGGETYILMSTLHRDLAPESYTFDKQSCSKFQNISSTYQLCVIRSNS